MAALSKTSVANLALRHLGNAKRIGNIDTEQSAEADACRAFYDLCLDKVLRDYHWPFATKFAVLGLVEEDPNDEWAFSYRYPSDCLMDRRILSGTRNDTRDTRVPYKVGRDDQGILIFTDQDEAQLEYTFRDTETNKYPPDFAMSLSLLLASNIAATVTGGDPFKLGDKAFQRYGIEISRATANAFNEEQPEENPDSELIRIRD